MKRIGETMMKGIRNKIIGAVATYAGLMLLFFKRKVGKASDKATSANTKTKGLAKGLTADTLKKPKKGKAAKIAKKESTANSEKSDKAPKATAKAKINAAPKIAKKAKTEKINKAKKAAKQAKKK